MPSFRIRMINSTFQTADDCDYQSLDEARKAALGAATQILAESMLEGERATAIELQINCDGSMVARHVVTLSVANLTLGEHSSG